MKHLLIAVLVFIALPSIAQNCKDYLLLQNNKTVEMTITNKKGKLSGKQLYNVSNLSTSGNETTATINTLMYDEKGKEIAKGENQVRCSGGIMMLNMKMMLPQQHQQQSANAKVTAESAYIEYPPTMKAGESLKDGNFQMEMDMNGMQQQVTMLITERKVEAKESITTPAGTWECFKITYKGKITIKTMGMGIPVNISGTEWFAPGFGIIKTQTNHGGTEITAIK